MPDKKPITAKQLWMGSVIALALHLSLAVLLGSACGAFESGPSAGLALVVTLIVVLLIQGVVLIVAVVSSFLRKAPGPSIGVAIGTALAMFIEVLIFGIPS